MWKTDNGCNGKQTIDIMGDQGDSIVQSLQSMMQRFYCPGTTITIVQNTSTQHPAKNTSTQWHGQLALTDI